MQAFITHLAPCLGPKQEFHKCSTPHCVRPHNPIPWFWMADVSVTLGQPEGTGRSTGARDEQLVAVTVPLCWVPQSPQSSKSPQHSSGIREVNI